ncbi:hypothetical protein [Parvibaculum lavamentivorans]|nr:hypothetical protein [Parvibaculum lavamentivorans]
MSHPAPTPRPETSPRATAFGAGIAARLGIALAAIALLWLAVFWALA